MILRPGAAPTCYTFVLLAVVISLASSQKGAKPQWANQKDQTKESSDNPASSNCSAEEASSYQCPTDKSCIPLDWIGDGENDCADGADESEAAIAFAANQNKSGKTVTGVDVDVPTTTTVVGTTTKTAITPPTPLGESKKGDPFSQIATKQPARTEQKTCSQQINKCSEQLVNWIVDLAKSNTSQLSVLHDQKSMSKIEEGCGLLPKYTMCMEKLAKSCVEQQPNQQLKEWLSMQMYMCELLVPSVKEHSSCFGAPRKAGCNLRQISAENSLMCSLVASAMADISCVEKMHKEECSETAVELIGPMKSETEHVLGDLNCSLPPSPTNISAEPENGEGEDAEVSAATQVSSTAQRVHPETSTTAAAPQTTSKAQESLSDLTNSLFSFGNVDLVCQHKIVPKSEDLWAPIRVKICARGDELKKYSQCFLETAKHEQSRCPSRLLKTTSCGAIDAFNKNIDCVVKSLNELCPVEAQDIVVEIQEKLNDEAISHKCYQGNTTASAAPNAPVNNDGFSLKPTTGRCSSDQENAALVCLVELIEINKQLAHFQSINFLLEISNPNSTVINGICSLYEKYEKCLDSSVFAQSKGQRCSFNSPLNTLARIGLSPVCGSSTRQLLFQSRDCLLEVSQQTQAAQCQSGLQSLGQTVQLMLQGIHGEALLCKSFYLLRNSLSVEQKSYMSTMNSIGLEEGCPAEEPDNLNEIIAKPIASSPPQNSGKAPIARPIALTGKAVNAGSTSASAASNTACEPEEQKKFGLCVQPLTAFQPHPLAVIKQPKQIDEACQSFKNFNGCRQDVKCNPLWARGMSAMFDYACEDGYQKYIKVRQCIRRTTTRSDIRECVLVFSKGAPQEACQSSNRLLACALPPVTEKCGAEGVEFVQEYVRRFAAAIDPQCKIGEKQEAAKPITPINCTANEDK
uniref:Uncharacterized protein n=1 Tax=Ditylenchus dipsaci TaxID=166011 RepID=A0A915ECU0_9BILA